MDDADRKAFIERNDIPLLYHSQYDDVFLRGQEEPRPWNITAILQSYLGPDDTLLDIGCGTCAKTMQLAKRCLRLYAIDPSASMRIAATQRATNEKLSNVCILDGIAEHLPFSEKKFNVACAIVAKHDTAELARVIVPGGYAILEKIGEEDKANIKSYFGNDEKGPRGYLSSLSPGERKRFYRDELSLYFDEVSIIEGRWETCYTPEQIIALCKNAKTIRNFDESRDRASIKSMIRGCSVNGMIRTIQHRLLIVARMPS